MEAWRIESRELVFGPHTDLGLAEDFSDCRWRGKPVCVRRWPIVEGHGPAQYLGHDAKLKIPKSAAATFERFASVRHPNVQLFMGMSVIKMSGDAGLVFEEVTRGTLAHALSDAEHSFDWDAKLQMVHDLAVGLSFLHGAKPPIFQPHLSSHNLLLDNHNRLKLGNIFEPELAQTMGKPFVASPPTLSAPEARAAKLGSVAAPSSATDIFHFGTICWEIFTGQSAVGAVGAQGLQNGDLPTLHSVPADVRELIALCWRAEPLQRPQLPNILSRLEALLQTGPTKIALTPQNAKRYQKRKLTLAFRSTDPVSVAKPWGKSQGKEGCWVVTGSESDDVYCVEDEVFRATYLGVGRGTNMYRKIGTILAKQMNTAFAIKTLTGTVELGLAGDWLAQNDKGEVWPIAAAMFAELYEEAPEKRGSVVVAP